MITSALCKQLSQTNQGFLFCFSGKKAPQQLLTWQGREVFENEKQKDCEKSFDFFLKKTT
jgi:hypothetical protein